MGWGQNEFYRGWYQGLAIGLVLGTLLVVGVALIGRAVGVGL